MATDPRLTYNFLMTDRKQAKKHKADALAAMNPVLPDYTDQIIKAIQQSQRPQVGRTRQASFGMTPFFGGML